MQDEFERTDSSLRVSEVTPLSEIPCRVSNIARGGGNTVPINRLKSVKPYRLRAAVAGNTEGKIRSNSIPRNDSGVEIPGWPKGHNTPALIFAYGYEFLYLWIRRR